MVVTTTTAVAMEITDMVDTIIQDTIMATTVMYHLFLLCLKGA
jgi:hypothetical protein